MKARTLLLGAGIGAGLYYMLRNRQDLTQGKLGGRLQEGVQTARSRLNEGLDAARTRVSEGMQAARGRMQPQTAEQAQTGDLENMIEEVAHRPDIPETPVKQAFEEAVHEHHRH